MMLMTGCGHWLGFSAREGDSGVHTGELPGRQSEADVVVFKSNGIAPWDLAIGHEVVRRARERGVGTTLDG